MSKYEYTKVDTDLIFPYLTDVELAFLILYNCSTADLFEMNLTEGERSEFEEGDNDVEVEMRWVMKDTPSTEYALNVFGDASVSQEEDDSGDWDNPPEAGDSWLTDVSVDTIYIDTPKEDAIEITKTLVEESHEFSWSDFIHMARKAAYMHINTTRVSQSLSKELERGPKEIPAKLQEKIDRLLRSPSYRAAKNLRLI
jgi:hypothetical protein